MIKFFQKIRYELLGENKIAKYLKYAFGEIILVVIGILIAIQINNSNQKRLNQESLEGYLNSIAQNIESDLKKAQKINETRLALFPRIAAIARRMSPDYYQIRSEVYGENLTYEDRYRLDNLDFMSQTIIDAWDLFYLTPNQSGFESLKSSGFLGQLQGTDLEKLLFDYYNLVDELTTQENNYNAGIKNSYENFINAGLSGTYAFFNPGIRDWNTELGGKLPELVDEIVEHPTMTPLFFWSYNLIIKYENLMLTGQALREMIITGNKNYTPEIKQMLEAVFDEYEDAPYSKVVRDGYGSTGYSYGVASAVNNKGVNIQYMDSFMAVQFFPEAWAVAYWFVGDGIIDPNRVKDFSSFKTLRLRLRGTQGGEEIAIALKDKSNPTDGSETKIHLTLTNEWKDYNIPLASFAPTNLEELFIVTSFITENKAFTIEVESIEFLK